MYAVLLACSFRYHPSLVFRVIAIVPPFSFASVYCYSRNLSRTPTVFFDPATVLFLFGIYIDLLLLLKVK
jgi:hypothetical protein